MTPLIDVVFLLLTFFVFSMALLVRAEVLDLKLPAVGGEGAPSDIVTIAIDAEGRFFVDGEAVEPADIAARARARVEERPGATLVVAGDERAAFGPFMEAVGALQQAGLTDFGILLRPAPAAAPGPVPPVPGADPEGPDGPDGP
jgi:biopolymer transport protein ExbD